MADQQDTGKLLLYGALAFAGYELFHKVLKPKIAQVKEAVDTKKYVERIKLGKISSVKVKKDQIEFKFPIQNPNVKPMLIEAIVGNVSVMDNKGAKIKLGQIAHYGKDIIAPTAATPFDLVARINGVNEFIYLSKVFNGKWVGQNLNFEGTITANGKPWPVNETVKIA